MRRVVRAFACGLLSVLLGQLTAATLPEGYVELTDGLAFSGGNWIETGYCPKAGDRFVCDLTFAAEQPNEGAAVFGTDGTGIGERAYAFRPRQSAAVDLAEVTYGQVEVGGVFPLDVRVSLEVGSDGATWEWAKGSGRLALQKGSPKNAVTPLLIGDVNVGPYIGDAEPSGAGAKMTLYRFTVTRNGLEIVHDYVPCRRIADSWPGLYDRIDGEFLPLMPNQAQLVVITSIKVVRTNDTVEIGVKTEPGRTYALLRSPTVTPRSAYVPIGIEAVAGGDRLTLIDRDKNRPKTQAFYVVEER